MKTTSLEKKKQTSEKAKNEALIKANVKNNINISKRKGNLRHPSSKRMTIERKTSEKAKNEALIKASVKITLTFQSGKEI